MTRLGWRQCSALRSVKPRQATLARRSAATSSHTQTCRSLATHTTHIRQQQPTQYDQSNVAAAEQSQLGDLQLWLAVDTLKRHGHRLAQLDPLRLQRVAQIDEVVPAAAAQLVARLLAHNGEQPSRVQTKGLLHTTDDECASAKELLERVHDIYAGRECGVEFAHMSACNEIEWLQREWERLNVQSDACDEQHARYLADLLLQCETFDHFMAAKFPTTKRYGCEGAESMLVVFDELLRLCQLGEHQQHIDDIIIGMPHRGRLNLLACLLRFEPAAIFAKTRGELELDARDAWMAEGDVLSHLSTNTRFVYGLDAPQIGLSRDSPRPINVSLLPNPSHLEISAPMCVGSARGRAHNLHYGRTSSPKFAPAPAAAAAAQSTTGARAPAYEAEFTRVLPVQVHGDAALAGQGIIQETLQMSCLPEFTVGGSLHIVVNNQIGYTTPASAGRSSRYCTDVFKLIEAPVVHVNGDNIHSVLRATRLALAYRQTFHKDIAIDLLCYRKHGHNEMDEPRFTQPLMYDAIRARPSTPQKYADSLGLTDEQRALATQPLRQKLNHAYKQLHESGVAFKPDNDNYRNFALPTEHDRDNLCAWSTGCALELLRDVALASVQTPPGDFRVHPTLQRALVDERRARFAAPSLEDIKVDWATAEMIAFGSLLAQNHSVRIAGQDVARGTFSTRHAILFDQHTERAHIPLNSMIHGQAKLEVANTVLSEEAAIAYEFGYAIETCELSLWEAQFGDFFNTAQSVIDTLVCSSERKWLKASPLTLLLPHGLDGAGPEHSSSHLERFLQMSSSSLSRVDTSATCNWSVCFPTLPAQYFHLLRRQVLRPYRKPLVVMSPKVIFRHASCVSDLRDFGPQATFAPVLDDPAHACDDAKQRAQVDTVVLCSGKVYFELEARRRERGARNVALVRLEELCPFPVRDIVRVLKSYPNFRPSSDKLVWLQEEHANQGAYLFVDARLDRLCGGLRPRYIGRAESELPATGSGVLHKREYANIMSEFESLFGAAQHHGESAS